MPSLGALTVGVYYMSESRTGALGQPSIMGQPSIKRAIRPANLLPLAALALFGTLLANNMQSLSGPAVWQALSSIAIWQWGAAATFTALSFRAVGTYDVLVHKLLDTGVPARAARRSGIVAIALAQTLGFGAITGAVARWRCLAQLGPHTGSRLGSRVGPATLARLSVVVSVSFLVALAALGALVIPLSGVMPLQSSWLVVSLVAVVGLFTLARLAFRQRWIPAPLTLPVFSSLFWATFLDTSFAAAALWVLWPDAISFHLVFAAYLIALAAGLVSNCPGGLGAFDLTLLGVLQVTDTNGAAAAILGFRVIYYIVPAVLAFAVLLRPALRPAAETTPQRADHPEGTLALQSANVISHHGSPLLTLPCWGKGAVYGDMPLRHALPKMPLYKCSAAQAVVARKNGWSILRCANEALIDVHDWSLQGSQKRQLRRALAAFSKSNLCVRPARSSDDLQFAADAWTAVHGREKGHSMGRFDPNYLRHQQVFVAVDGDIIVGFVSLHTTASQWTLDIMRHTANLPKGTMQALVVAAIHAAQAADVTTVSLAAVPHPAENLPFARRACATSSGLYRFKSAFAPRWVPRYICARNPVSLALTMATLAWAIHRPPALPSSAQKNDEHYSFAPPRASCEGISSL